MGIPRLGMGHGIVASAADRRLLALRQRRLQLARTARALSQAMRLTDSVALRQRLRERWRAVCAERRSVEAQEGPLKMRLVHPHIYSAMKRAARHASAAGKETSVDPLEFIDEMGREK